MPRLWRVRSKVISFDRPVLMGVVNTTPDSFSDGGRFDTVERAVAHGLALVDAGADIVDVGGESTRPGADPVSASEEIARVVPVIDRLAADGVLVSVDTTKPEVAEAALTAGASIVNDVSGLGSAEMRVLVADSGAGAIVMHMQGTPRTMQDDPRYDDVVVEIRAFLTERLQLGVSAGISPEAVALDPGIGFGKTVEHNLAIIDRLHEFRSLGCPVVLGASRKRFLGALTGRDAPSDRDLASAVAAAIGVVRGADILRVHNVAATREAAQVAWAIVRGAGAQWAPVVGTGVGEG